MSGVAVIRVERAGAGLSVQDGGRRGWMRFGVPPGGPMDPHAARQANRLAGNPPGAPLLEVYRMGARLRILAPALVAVAGAGVFRGFPPWRARVMEAGAELCAEEDGPGVWAYVAVRGGLEAPRWLGSASVNPRAGFGAFLRAGAVLGAAGNPLPDEPRVGERFSAPGVARDYDEPPVLRVYPGPQAELFEAEARAVFFGAEWRVSAESDRCGSRLDGPAVRVPEAELESEPVLPGSVQVPPGGRPLVTMPDGPTLGGYHKIGVLHPDDLGWLAQVKPGRAVRFGPVAWEGAEGGGAG